MKKRGKADRGIKEEGKKKDIEGNKRGRKEKRQTGERKREGERKERGALPNACSVRFLLQHQCYVTRHSHPLRHLIFLVPFAVSLFSSLARMQIRRRLQEKM